MVLGNGGTDGGESLVVRFVQILALYLIGNHQLFFTTSFYGKSDAATRSQGCMTFFNGQFKILWIMIATTNDDQIFEASGNKQFTISDKAQIARTQEWPLAGSKMGAEGCLALLFTLPVALS